MTVHNFFFLPIKGVVTFIMCIAEPDWASVRALTLVLNLSLLSYSWKWTPDSLKVSLLVFLFLQTFNGKKWEKFNSEKVATLAYARIQGKPALIAHFQNSSLMNEDKKCRPILLNCEGSEASDQVGEPLQCRLTFLTLALQVQASVSFIRKSITHLSMIFC